MFVSVVFIASMKMYFLILIFAVLSWQIVSSPPRELADRFAEAVSPEGPHSLPSWAEQEAQVYAAAPSPDSTEIHATARPLVERYFDLAAAVDVQNCDSDSCSSE